MLAQALHRTHRGRSARHDHACTCDGRFCTSLRLRLSEEDSHARNAFCHSIPRRDLSSSSVRDRSRSSAHSRKVGSVGHALVRNLIYGGYTGVIYPVNPKAKGIQGVPCFPDLERHRRSRRTWSWWWCRPRYVERWCCRRPNWGRGTSWSFPPVSRKSAAKASSVRSASSRSPANTACRFWARTAWGSSTPIPTCR